MSQYYILVNPAKREYLNPGSLGENIQGISFPGGGCMTVQALAILVCRTDELYSGWDKWGPLAGSWAGDTIIAAGDEQHGPNPYGVQAANAEKSEENLYHLASWEFKDISAKVIIMFYESHVRPRTFLRALVQESKTDDSLLKTLGDAVFVEGYKRFDMEMRKQWGPEWVAQYEEVAKR